MVKTLFKEFSLLDDKNNKQYIVYRFFYAKAESGHRIALARQDFEIPSPTGAKSFFGVFRLE